MSVSEHSRSCIKMASFRLKRAVGGPKRSEGRSYRGLLESRTVCLTAAELLTQSDREAISPGVRENASRTTVGENAGGLNAGGLNGVRPKHHALKAHI